MRRIAVLLIALLWAQTASAAIARENTGTILLGLDNPTAGLAYTRAFNAGGSTLTRVFFAYLGDTGATDNVASVTYNGGAMTFIARAQATGGRWAGMYFRDLGTPDGLSHNFVATMTANGVVMAWAKAYTGVKQTGAVDASGSNSTGGATSLSAAITVVAANSWGIAFLREETVAAATWTAGTTSELSASTGGHFADSNGTLATGAQNFTCTFGASQTMGMVAASFEPDTGAAPSCTPSLTLLGVGRCGD